MKKKFECEIDCANCAAKAEDARFEEILTEAIRIGKTIEPDFKVLGV